MSSLQSSCELLPSSLVVNFENTCRAGASHILTIHSKTSLAEGTAHKGQSEVPENHFLTGERCRSVSFQIEHDSDARALLTGKKRYLHNTVIFLWKNCEDPDHDDGREDVLEPNARAFLDAATIIMACSVTVSKKV